MNLQRNRAMKTIIKYNIIPRVLHFNSVQYYFIYIAFLTTFVSKQFYNSLLISKRQVYFLSNFFVFKKRQNEHYLYKFLIQTKNALRPMTVTK